MTIFAAALGVLLMVVTGLAMFRRLARYLLASQWSEMSETDPLLLGILPGMALVGALATYIALLHLLRPWFVVFLAIAILGLLRRDVYAILAGLRAAAAGSFAQMRQGNLFPLIAAAIGLVMLAVGLLLCVIPSDNVDVWAYHIPLAQSFVAHAGITVPQINHLFYGNQPLFFELLFAVASLAVNHFAAAGAVNLAIFFGLLLLLLSFAQRARGFQFLIVCAGFIWRQSFLLDATQPMIDLPRSCFSVAAYLFAYRYLRGFRRFDLTICALLAGAAVAGKYTELVTPALIGMTLAPFMLVRRQTWAHVIPAGLAFTGVACFWYIKNTFYYGNPIYPLLFGHPGISDAWVADFMRALSIPFDIADRAYSTNLLTARGWRDFAHVLRLDFRSLIPAALLAVAGLGLPQPRRWLLPLWSFILFVIWYAIMFNGTRWAASAMLLLLCTAYITWFWICDQVLAWWETRPTGSIKAFGNALPLLLGVMLIATIGFGVLRLASGHSHFILPRWMDRDMAMALVRPGGVDAYLAQSRADYVLYRYIGDHNLMHVFQPFDDGAFLYATAYNGGHPNDWIVNYRLLPAGKGDENNFIVRHDIHYFIDADHISPTDNELLGPSNVVLAKAMIATLKPHSTLLLRDTHGNALYKIQAASVR